MLTVLDIYCEKLKSCDSLVLLEMQWLVYTSTAFTKSLVYTQQPFIVDAYSINHCISQKRTLKSPLMDFKQGREGRVSFHFLAAIQFKRHKIRGYSFICTLQCILPSCDTICDSAVFHMTAYDIYANSAHDPVCE